MSSVERDAWKATVEVQKHFNDLQLRTRQLLLTGFAALSSALLYAAKEQLSIRVGSIDVALAAAVAIFGVCALFAFYIWDFGYLALLKGAVRHGIAIEKGEKVGDSAFGLAQAIGEASDKVGYLPAFFFCREGSLSQSQRRLAWTYRIFAFVILFFGAVGQIALPGRPTPTEDFESSGCLSQFCVIQMQAEQGDVGLTTKRLTCRCLE